MVNIARSFAVVRTERSVMLSLVDVLVWKVLLERSATERLENRRRMSNLTNNRAVKEPTVPAKSLHLHTQSLDIARTISLTVYLTSQGHEYSSPGHEYSRTVFFTQKQAAVKTLQAVYICYC